MNGTRAKAPSFCAILSLARGSGDLLVDGFLGFERTLVIAGDIEQIVAVQCLG